MDKLFRFRRCEDHCFTNLFKNRIEGAKYSTMQDPKEVSLWADVEELKTVTKLDEEYIRKTCDVIRDHIINSYYIACFAKTDQMNNLDMWKEYAGLDGFCLVYNMTSISNAVRYSLMIQRERFHLFRSVDYGHLPTDITAFIKDYLMLVGDELENEEAHKRAAKHVGDSLTSEERTRITGSMFHKIGSFIEKDEMRIVTQTKKDYGPYCDDMVLVPIKPIEIVCSSLMPLEKRNLLEKYARKNKIKFSIKEIGT